MLITISLYPLLAKSTGFTKIFSDDGIDFKDLHRLAKTHTRLIEEVLDEHCAKTNEDEEDVNEYERYTMILSYRKTFLVSELPLTIPHSTPTSGFSSYKMQNMTKAEIRSETLQQAKNMIRNAEGKEY